MASRGRRCMLRQTLKNLAEPWGRLCRNLKPRAEICACVRGNSSGYFWTFLYLYINFPGFHDFVKVNHPVEVYHLISTLSRILRDLSHVWCIRSCWAIDSTAKGFSQDEKALWSWEDICSSHILSKDDINRCE